MICPPLIFSVVNREGIVIPFSTTDLTIARHNIPSIWKLAI